MISIKHAIIIASCIALNIGWSSPEVFAKYLPPDTFVRGSSGVVNPPLEIEPYIGKIQSAATANPKWFREYSKNATPGVPLPYHEKLGITQEEYKQYRALWDKRTFEAIQPVALRLEKASDGNWMIRATGEGFPISSLRYNLSSKQLTSPNGELKKMSDLIGDKDSTLGAWKGEKWSLESETSISKTRESFAIGKKSDENAGYIIYRLIETTTSGRPLYDKQILIKFPIEK